MYIQPHHCAAHLRTAFEEDDAELMGEQIDLVAWWRFEEDSNVVRWARWPAAMAPTIAADLGIPGQEELVAAVLRRHVLAVLNVDHCTDEGDLPDLETGLKAAGADAQEMPFHSHRWDGAVGAPPPALVRHRGYRPPGRQETFQPGLTPQAIAAAQGAERRWGIPASVQLAQYGTESSFGRHMPAGSNNPFGVKAKAGQRSVMASTTEVIDGERRRVRAPFRAYDSLSMRLSTIMLACWQRVGRCAPSESGSRM